MRSLAASLVLLSTLFLPAIARAAAAKDCKPPSWAPEPLPGFEIAGCDERAWDTFEVYVARDSTWIAGHWMSVDYRPSDPSKKTPTGKETLAHFVELGKKAGGTVVEETNVDAAETKKSTPSGDVWMVAYHYGHDDMTQEYRLWTVEVLPLPHDVETREMPGPLDVTAPCGNPPWVVKTFASYKVRSCTAKAWDTDTLDVTGGRKEVAGKRTTVTYELVDEKDAKSVATAPRFHRNFVEALEKSGAQIVYGEKDDNADVRATQKTPAGEFFFEAARGNGNSGWVGTYSLTTWQIEPPSQEVEARPMKGALEIGTDCQDPPWLVKQFPYFTRKACKNRDFDSVEVYTKDGKKTIAGRVHQATYALNDEKKDPVKRYVRLNYVNALEKIGAELVSKPDSADWAVLTQKNPAGDLWYVWEHGNGNDESTGTYTLTTVQVGAPPPKKCTMEIYGVNFDFDKATLRPDSEPVLSALLALFQKDPKLSGEISGHTDNVGKADYNQKLSGERAEAVKAWLVAKGIAASRLTTKGYGDTKPLVPNTNDENRAKNRRVELTRENCRGK